MKTLVGIDVGATGGIAILRNGRISAVRMPKDDMAIDEYLSEILTEDTIVYIEKVQMWMGDKGGGKMFRMQALIGMYRMILSMVKRKRVQYVEVPPQTWQSTLGLLKDRKKDESKTEKKNRHKVLAQSLFPEVKVNLANVDAILICEYGRRMSGDDFGQLIRDTYARKHSQSNQGKLF